jgi:hypothetical protein
MIDSPMKMPSVDPEMIGKAIVVTTRQEGVGIAYSIASMSDSPLPTGEREGNS